VWHTRQLLQQLASEGRLALYVDLHGHSRSLDAFFYCCRPPPPDLLVQGQQLLLPREAEELQPSQAAALAAPAAPTAALAGMLDSSVWDGETGGLGGQGAKAEEVVVGISSSSRVDCSGGTWSISTAVGQWEDEDERQAATVLGGRSTQQRGDQQQASGRQHVGPPVQQVQQDEEGEEQAAAERGAQQYLQEQSDEDETEADAGETTHAETDKQEAAQAAAPSALNLRLGWGVRGAGFKSSTTTQAAAAAAADAAAPAGSHTPSQQERRRSIGTLRPAARQQAMSRPAAQLPDSMQGGAQHQRAHLYARSSTTSVPSPSSQQASRPPQQQPPPPRKPAGQAKGSAGKKAKKAGSFGTNKKGASGSAAAGCTSAPPPDSTSMLYPVQQLPWLAHQAHPGFSYARSTFNESAASVASTARGAVSCHLGLARAYTLEASLAGSSTSMCHFSVWDYMALGRALCEALAEMSVELQGSAEQGGDGGGM
jgi:hypothetical protein